MRQQFDNISWSCHKQRSQAGMAVEDSKMLPLHIVCHYSCQIFNMEFFRQLIEAYPQATKEKDTKGDLFCTMFVR